MFSASHRHEAKCERVNSRRVACQGETKRVAFRQMSECGSLVKPTHVTVLLMRVPPAHACTRSVQDHHTPSTEARLILVHRVRARVDGAVVGVWVAPSWAYGWRRLRRLDARVGAHRWGRRAGAPWWALACRLPWYPHGSSPRYGPRRDGRLHAGCHGTRTARRSSSAASRGSQPRPCPCAAAPLRRRPAPRTRHCPSAERCSTSAQGPPPTDSAPAGSTASRQHSWQAGSQTPSRWWWCSQPLVVVFTGSPPPVPTGVASTAQPAPPPPPSAGASTAQPAPQPPNTYAGQGSDSTSGRPPEDVR